MKVWLLPLGFIALGALILWRGRKNRDGEYWRFGLLPLVIGVLIALPLV